MADCVPHGSKKTSSSPAVATDHAINQSPRLSSESNALQSEFDCACGEVMVSPLSCEMSLEVFDQL